MRRACGRRTGSRVTFIVVFAASPATAFNRVNKGGQAGDNENLCGLCDSGAGRSVRSGPLKSQFGVGNFLPVTWQHENHIDVHSYSHTLMMMMMMMRHHHQPVRVRVNINVVLEVKSNASTAAKDGGSSGPDLNCPEPCACATRA